MAPSREMHSLQLFLENGQSITSVSPGKTVWQGQAFQENHGHLERCLFLFLLHKIFQLYLNQIKTWMYAGGSRVGKNSVEMRFFVGCFSFKAETALVVIITEWNNSMPIVTPQQHDLIERSGCSLFRVDWRINTFWLSRAGNILMGVAIKKITEFEYLLYRLSGTLITLSVCFGFGGR